MIKRGGTSKLGWEWEEKTSKIGWEWDKKQVDLDKHKKRKK